MTFGGERIRISWERVYWEEIFPGGSWGGISEFLSEVGNLPVGKTLRCGII